MDWWYRFYSVQDTDPSWQLKMTRINNGEEQDSNTFFQNGWWNNWSPQGYNWIWPHGPTFPNDGDRNAEYSISQSTWHHWTLFIKQSSTGSATDGEIYLWLDGTLVANEDAMNTWNGSISAQRATFAWYIGNAEDDTEAHMWYDDIYIDNSWQSVWIGDNSNWDNCTHREIQIPAAWSDTSITTEVNQGSFPTCERLYLFVVDADGNVNTQGYPIRIVTAAGEPPCPPMWPWE